VWPDGAKYEGQWENDKANGKGTFWHVDGDIFEGKIQFPFLALPPESISDLI
jgi:hypothetical protein